ncbi:MAG: hypothetical protein IPL46_13755 [Saprospiraceae bacterium]|nr:hypothetical protein [Saprospiraceae bacterium]
MKRGIENMIPEPEPKATRNLNIWANKIAELRDLAASCLTQDLENKKTGGDEHLPIFLSLRHAIELLDAISLQIRNSSIDPCKLLLRGLLETYFNLEYLFAGDWKQKAYQFIATLYQNKIKFYKKLDHSDSSHGNFKSPFITDKRMGGYPFSELGNLDMAISNLERLFEKPEYSNIKSEFERLKSEKEGNPKWFRLFDGPKTISGLARELKLGGLYETYYRFWSGPLHGTDVVDGKITSNSDGKLEIYQIRLPFEAQSITHSTFTLAFYIIDVYLNNRLPDKKADLNKWYLTNRDFYMQLGGEQVIKNAG